MRSERAAAALVLSFSLVVTGCGPNAPADGPAAAPASPAAPVAATTGGGGPAPLIEASTSPDAPTRVLDPRADEILREMSRFLAATRRFAFEAEESFDEIPSGQPRVLLTNLRRVAVERPNRFAADVEGDSLSRSVWFDGRSIATYDRAQNAYATIPAAGSIDAALDMLAQKYGVEVPLADLLYSDPYGVLIEAATYSKYLGIHRAAGVPCHHLVCAQPTIEWQIWIEAGDKPLPRKMAITYVREPGEPQYLAAISRWSLSPSFPDGLFRFEPPEGAERIDAAALALGAATGATLRLAIGIGGVIDGGSGAAVGAAVGAVAGTAVAAGSSGNQVNAAAGSALQFQVARPLTVTVLVPVSPVAS